MEQAKAIETERALDAEIGPFMHLVSTVSDPVALARMGNDFIRKFPPQRALSIASLITFANPFFLADMGPANAKNLAINLDQFAELTMRAKLTAHHAVQPNILVACAPKSASTFIQDALIKATGLPPANLMAATHTPYAGSMLGMNLKEQETDELALIRNGLNGRGYVAQHHMRCSPFIARQLALFNIRPIITIRNIFDTLVSLDDMFNQWRAQAVNPLNNYFDDGLPVRYTQMEREERLHVLAERNVAWYIQFLLSWRRCEAMGLVAPLWVSYEQDFLGDKAVLAQKIASFVGLGAIDPDRLAACFEDRSDGKAKRLNKGVAGRGADLPDSVRDKVLTIFSRYQGETDFSVLLGDAG